MSKQEGWIILCHLSAFQFLDTKCFIEFIERMSKEISKYFVKNKLNVENCVLERANSLIYMYWYWYALWFE